MSLAAHEYDHVRCTRKCAASGRDLTPGETFYSALFAEGASLVRRDYAADAWHGPPEGAVGWWKTHLPLQSTQRMHWAPNDVMLDLLDQLAADPTRADMRYVLALLLVRRRVCRLEDSDSDDPEAAVSLRLYCPRRDVQYTVPVVTPSDTRTAEIQEELAKLLFAA